MGSESAGRQEAHLAARPAQYELLERLGRICERQHTRAFLVGGPVRDLMLGLASPDLDIAVETDSRTVGRKIAEELGGRFVYHSRFLTGTVSFCPTTDPGPQAPPGGHIDIARTRIETYAKPAKLPQVKPAAVEEDLARRDFTINAMALAIAPREFGRLLDPHDGRIDVARRLVRVLHDRSFIDDPTRAFRAIRFATRLGFEIEPRTLELMRASIKEGYPRLLTPERILYELKLICAEPKAARMFEAILKEGLLESCFAPTTHYSLLTAHFLPGLHRLSRQNARPELLYLYVLSKLPLTDRFPITRLERDSAQAVNLFQATRTRLLQAGKPSAVYRLLQPVPAPALELLSFLEPAPVSRRITDYLDNLSRVRVSSTGADLRRLGLAPGPRYRRILDSLLYARLDGKVRSDQEELRLAGTLARKALRK